MDFAGSVVDGGGIIALEDAFEQVLETGNDMLDASVAEEALMAAEIVARMNGRPGPQSTYFEKIDAWIAAQREKPTPALINRARRALRRILGDNSEIVTVWQDSGEYEGWKASVESVQGRL
jgi:imidazole glycerol phosphate synthase subunit HisF